VTKKREGKNEEEKVKDNKGKEGRGE